MWRAPLSILLLTTLALPAVARISVIDDAGRRVELGAPAHRIISLSPALTESLFAAGAGARVTATVKGSDFPREARALPRLGDASGVALEGLVAMRPDLVLAWGSATPGRLLSRLRELGIPVYVSEVRTLDGVAATLERLGALAGTDEAARGAAAAYRADLQALRRRYEGSEAVPVFYQLWPRPLMTIGGDHLISRVLEVCGGHNVFGELTTLAPKIGVEAVVARDPAVIVAAVEQGMADPFALWSRWPQLRAVRERHLVAIDADLLHRPTPRLLAGAARLCRALAEIRGSLQ